MCPELVTVGPVTLYTYGLALLAALAASGLYVHRVLVGKGFAPGSVLNLLFAAALGGLVGARAAYVLTHLSEYAGRWWEVFWLPAGGLVFQGGAIGGALAVWAVARYERLSRPAVMDAAAPALALGAAMGRLGCLANGCCAGRPSSAWYAFSFVDYAEPRVPVQLLDLGYNLALFALLVRWSRRPHREGDLLWGWFAGYGAARFAVEFLRAAPGGAGAAGTAGAAAVGLNPRVMLGLTAPQLIALAMVVLGVAMLARGRWWGPRAEADAPDAGAPVADVPDVGAHEAEERP